jgi:nitrogen fixation NifU-like protein
VKEDLKKLYTQVIKAHNEKPFHFNKMENASKVVQAYNPICGDRFEIFMDMDARKINAIHFHGFGCAISKASASVLAQTLEGKTLRTAISICNDFLRFINKELKTVELTLPLEFQAFAGVHDYPERYDCAALSWKEVRNYLESMESKSK